jgi:hypothetical protein
MFCFSLPFYVLLLPSVLFRGEWWNGFKGDDDTKVSQGMYLFLGSIDPIAQQQAR